jgi:septal ring factor EnvC (AmiA/AmiB activator)
VDLAKMYSEQYQKQMAQQNAKMEKLQQTFLESQENMAAKFNANLNELEQKLRDIQEQQRTTVVVCVGILHRNRDILDL